MFLGGKSMIFSILPLFGEYMYTHIYTCIYIFFLMKVLDIML